ncbi:alpha-hydroxy-acid oxidizing protein (plasmid) [Erwinia sp. INIA-01]|uniref:alpha-hydroxy-acid oxidizing protein n=1 Tax=Erwinia sp. INIA01 TaxID=2991500 RepID=UPI002225647B|nr:alpha-hydroxy-acid oxidizing protein [Erwinia sp. INIA01]MCW1873056.1 alpha-hydroxy-acid oxidizing protein [Erwinia sp. INIA01]
MKGKLVNVEDYRRLAAKTLPRIIFDFLEGGAEDEKGLVHNRDVFDQWRFTPHRLVDVSERNISTHLFGKNWSAPFAIAPTGFNGALWPGGDIKLAKAAASANIPFILSTASNASIEDVARCAEGEKWFQLYVVQQQLAEQLVMRALNAGYTTLIVTVDVGVNGNRERDRRNQFSLPLKITPSLLMSGCLHPAWSMRFVQNGMPQLANFVSAESGSLEAQAAVMSRQMDAGFNPNSLKRIREMWPHKLLVKGIIRPEDAELCVACGADGVILSNHGGRQLDGNLSPLETLAEVAARIDSPVLADSGFRRGSDIVKALCLGADMVLLGRATLYGLAARGLRGVDEVIALLKSEVDCNLAQIGCPAVDDLSAAYLQRMS